MAFCDFVVKYDPNKDTSEDITKRVLCSIIVKRLKANKPAVCFVGGDSGEGKSLSNIRLQQLLLEIQGLEIRDYFNDINVYNPIQYAQKLDNLLFDKRLKKVNIICVHEAREVVKAKMWHSFLTQSVADINAMSRSIKRLCVMITSQFIRDITNDIRYTLNYYMIVRRPRGKRARLYINVMWKDDRDLEKPKLRKRKLSGYLVYPNGRYRRYVPQYLELKKPDKDLIDMFEKADTDAKKKIIRKKIDRLLSEMRSEIGEESKKVDTMVDWYCKDLDTLSLIGKRYKKGWRVSTKFQEMHELSKYEIKDFEKKLNSRLQERGMTDAKEQAV